MERRESESAVVVRDWRREKAIPSFHVRSSHQGLLSNLSLSLSLCF